MGSVATRYGEGWEALCRNIEAVSQLGAKPPLSRQGILCRDRELKKVYRDKKFLVATGTVVWCHDTAFWCCDRAELAGQRRYQAYSQWARLRTRQSALHARQSAMCMHCADDRPVTVHCVVHYLGHCSWAQ